MGLLDFLANPLGSRKGWDSLPETKLYAIDDQRAVLTVNTMLVHGPGASDQGWRGGDGNSVVFACLMALAKGFVEPPLRVWQLGPEGQRDPQPDNPMQKLLDRPNPFMDQKELLFWLSWAKHCDGNAYVRKIRAGNDRTGNVVQLWPISPTLCEPVTYRGSNDFISAYRYTYAPGKFEDIPPENIIHFRLGVDDRDLRRGLSPLKRLVRLISSDDEAAKFAHALVTNSGVPGLVVIPGKDSEFDEDTARQIKERASATFGNENRGNVAVVSPGSDVKQFGFSPQDLNLKALHQIPETRICADMGVPPAVVGVSVGLEQTSNYASFKEVREQFVEGTLLPQWTMDAAKVTHSLAPDFTNDPRIILAFDISDVRALQEDVNAMVERLDKGVISGWIKPNEARSEIGLPPLPELDALPAPAAQPPALQVVKALAEVKRRGDLNKLPELYAALVELARPSFEAEVVDFLSAQKDRVQRALVSGQ